ncbi:AAA family ATPase [Arcicella lustrica]|uniref:ATP-binding protein n=1 Tax=Arcicella lustrica TaxID=2984196 RepID=A0ABU5SFK7_9BACT|nr:ATP-binding protein [Arcicella sp. DC25W]MEA5425987.1 ATP-binding protein [Arcicella sp. DC25W]
MIIEFNVENYLSFKDLTTLSMVATKSFKEHSNTHLIEVDKKLELLKSAIIYGNNASGKSNLLEAMGFMKEIVLTSYKNALEDTEKGFSLEKFKLNSKNENESSFFEVSFIHKEIKYRYGFELDYKKVVAEWLYHTTSKEVYLFKRDFQTIEVNKSAFKEGIGRENDTKETVLFLSMLATNNKEISSIVVDWFQKLRFINGIHDQGHKRYTINKLKNDSQFLNWVTHFIKYLEIANLSTTEEDVREIDFEVLREKAKDEEMINLFASIQKIQSRQPRRDHLITYHRKYDENNIFIDSIPFNFDNQESEGTKKLLYLLGPLYDTLRNGHILVIDELDSRLHSNLTQKLISFFHKFNKNNAQLIFAVHDISLLNKDTFRRDQIYFIEKNQFGVSELFSLADFKTDKVRNKSAFDKNYALGKYGAIPYFEMDEKLNQLLYGQVG